MILTALRLLRIVRVTLRYGLDQIALSGFKHPWMARIIRVLALGRTIREPRGARLRMALEELGPIFVKFGQVLSTRRDLLPADIADELAGLQDRVPPFPSELAVAQIEQGLGRKIVDVFVDFEMTPVASASIAQVHFARLKSGKDAGREVAIKVLRPNMMQVIDKDLALMQIVAALVERLWADGKRLKPREVVSEFDKYLHDELDLVREAANCSQLRRNFMPGSPREHLLSIPEVFWDYCVPSVMVMERMHGVPVSQVQALRELGVDMQKLSRDGVEIFFSQVFGDGFFHADMHPGNIFVSDRPATLGRYIALDFGIVGTLSEFDKNYLAQNFLAFFQRDYRRVAELHIESQWAPPETRVEELEAAVRTCCEPYFDRPLKEISLGQVLLRLFQTSRRFNVEVQPQLVLLQKTLLNIEGLGRQLDPDLDLWKTAKPYLENWMQERIGLKGLEAKARQEAALWARTLPELPRLIHERLMQPDHSKELLLELRQLRQEQQHTNRLYSVAVGVLLIMAFAAIWHWVR